MRLDLHAKVVSRCGHKLTTCLAWSWGRPASQCVLADILYLTLLSNYAGSASVGSSAAFGALSSVWLVADAAMHRLGSALSLNAVLEAANAKLGALFDSKDNTEYIMLLMLFVGLYAVLRRRRALRNLYGPPPAPITRQVATPPSQQPPPPAGSTTQGGEGTQQQPAAGAAAEDHPAGPAVDAAAARRAVSERAAALATARLRQRPAASSATATAASPLVQVTPATTVDFGSPSALCS